MAKKDKEEEIKVTDMPLQEKIVPIKWNVPDAIITRFASNMIVQQSEDYFKLSFFELKPEINLIAPAVPETEMKADCVASIVVTPAKLRAIVKVLDRQLKVYEEKQAKAKAKDIISSEPEQPS